MTTRLLTCLCAVWALTGAGSAAAGPVGPLRVAVSIEPLAGFVERIAGDRVVVVVAVPRGASPATHDVSPRLMVELTAARLFFTTGVPMERLLLPRLQEVDGLRIVDTTAGLERLALADHDHGDGDDHDAEGLDPHVWLDPRLAARQAGAIADALSAADPDGAALYRANAAAFATELAALDADLRTILAPVRGRTLYVFHPSFGYLAAAYGLEQVAIEQGGLDPSPRRLTRIMTGIRESGARAVFVQPQFSVGSATAVAKACDVRLVELDPLARDYAANLRSMALAIAGALE
jgi:zinc transport system substrate-binding protein